MKNLDSILPISDEGLYPIRTVSELSGVNSITLRAWERRYDLFKPKRTPKGHRLYSEKDIQRIHQVLALLAKGVSIGRVARVLKENETEEHEHAPTLLSVKPDNVDVKEPTKTQWNEYQSDLLNIVRNYDISQLESLHHELLSRFSFQSVSKNLILPVIETLDNQAEELSALAGEYHFYKVFILQRIGGIFQKSSIQNSGKKILVMGDENHHCNVKLLLFSMPLLQRGYQVVVLGCNVPLDAIPTSISASNTDALLLFSNVDELTDQITSTFKTAIESSNKPIFLSGQHSKDQEKQLSRLGLFLLPSNLEKQFDIIDKNLNKSSK